VRVRGHFNFSPPFFEKCLQCIGLRWDVTVSSNGVLLQFVWWRF